MYKENPVATLALNPHRHSRGTIQEETIFEQVYHFQNLQSAIDTSQKPSQTMPMISFANGFQPRQQTFLNETSNFQLPSIDLPQPRPPSRNSTSRMVVEPLEALPFRQRRHPLNYPIPLSTDEAKQNLRALAERKSTSPTGRRVPTSESSLAYTRRSGSSIPTRTTTPDTNNIGTETLLERRRKRISTPNFDLIESRGQDKKEFHLIIQRGSLQTHTELFAQYFQLHLSLWSNINRILRYLERLMHQYTVPLALIDGDRVAQLEEKLGVKRNPTIEELFSTVVNREEVDQYIQRTIRAVVIIQSYWRGKRARQYLSYLRRRRRAAHIITSAFLKYNRSKKFHEQMKIIRQRQFNFFQKKQSELRENWTYVMSNRRTIIHLPSLGFLTSIRKNIKDLSRRENYQIGRLCDLEDPNVNIIYISSLPITEEILQYYDRLINLRPMVEQGNEKAGQIDPLGIEKRFTMIVPEAVTRFPDHPMCLATLLKYSPKALKQIKSLIHNQNAYLISSISHVDDLSIAEYLNIPIFGCEPELSYLYSTKSGSKRIFQTSEIPMPFGDYDIYDEKHLFQSLTKLILDHLDIQRWIFKIDDYFDGLGIAYCDIIEHLSCYDHVYKHAANKEKQNELLQQIYTELPMILDEHVQFVDTNQFDRWSNYLKVFLSHGGIIEAFPTSDTIQPITVCLAIEPDGHHSIICSGHQLYAESIFSCWGLAFPQSALEPSKLNQYCSAIVEQCQQRHISGYIDIDFLLFTDSTNQEEKCWAIDLSIGYSEHVALYHVMRYVTTGRFNPQKHLFTIKSKQTKQRLRNWQNGAPEQIINEQNSYAIWSTRLFHSNFAQMSYSQFFGLCRTRGVGFDIRKKQGSIFTLIEGSHHQHLGFITISDTIENTRKSFLNNLKIINEALKQNVSEISSNFQFAIDHLEQSKTNNLNIPPS